SVPTGVWPRRQPPVSMAAVSPRWLLVTVQCVRYLPASLSTCSSRSTTKAGKNSKSPLIPKICSVRASFAEVRFRGRYWGNSGHDVLHRTCLLLTQSGHRAATVATYDFFDCIKCPKTGPVAAPGGTMQWQPRTALLNTRDFERSRRL